jgi:hypothetical protein
MSVEQQGLGGFEVLGVFYEIKSSATRCGDFKGNTRRAHERPSCCEAGFGRFIAMKLQQRRRKHGTGRCDVSGCSVDEQQHRRHKRRQATRQFGGAFGTDKPGAGGVHHKTNGIGTGRDSGVHVFLTRQAADLDTGPQG